jgi:type II secretory pathway pseudopilin PulG
MILAEEGGPWKLSVVLVILAALGYALTPVLQRYSAGAEAQNAAERLLGTLGDIEVFAVRGEARSVTIGSNRMPLASSEGIVLRELT